MSRTLVACFSASGRTAAVAEALSSRLAAELFRILPEEPYSLQDLNWMDRRSRTSLEMSDSACRPALAGVLPDFSSYDLFLLGFPIWWQSEPRLVDTFLECADFSGKLLIPFATSAGSDICKAEERLALISPAAIWQAGFLVNDEAGFKDLLLASEQFDSRSAAAL